MKQQAMTEDQLKSFVESVHNYHHKHEEVDITKDIAYYILDLLRQGYSVQGILGKLKGLRAIAAQNVHDMRYADSITKFSLAIRNPRSKSISQWISFHTQKAEGANVA